MDLGSHTRGNMRAMNGATGVMVIDIVAIISILGLSLHSDHRTDRLPTDIR